MCTLRTTALSIFKDGFDSHREPVDVAWDEDAMGDATGSIHNGTVRLVDGWQRVLSCMMIVHLLMQQEAVAALDETANSLIHTLAVMKCNFELVAKQEMHIYSALKLQFRGTEKQRPSPITLVESFILAVDAKAKSVRIAVSKRDLLDTAISEYNAMCSNRSWKIVGSPKDVIRNLMRVPAEMRMQLHSHYDKYRHDTSALHMLNLGGAEGFYVPGCRRPLKNEADPGPWRCIFTVTDLACLTWCSRCI